MCLASSTTLPPAFIRAVAGPRRGRQVDGYNVVSLASDCQSSARMRLPRLVCFCKRFKRLDNAAFAAEFMRSIKRIPLR